MGRASPTHADTAGTTAGKRVWLALAAVVVLGPSVLATWWPTEVWPWTCAPMFSAPLADGRTALYAPTLTVTTATGAVKRFDPRSIGMSQWHLRRLLLVEAYGSAVPGTPFGYRAGDDEATLTARLDAFFDAMVAAARSPRHSRQRGRFPADARTVTLALQGTNVDARFEIGSYDVERSTFVLGPAP